MPEKTIPILPCPSIPELVEFYEHLGFTVDLLQTRPNPYAALSYGDGIALQFFGHKAVEPAGSWSTCYITTDRVDALYAAFRAGLKAAYGRVPTRGIPRIGQLKDTSYGVRQFLVTDPGGNCLRIGQPTGAPQEHTPAPQEPFARALHQAWLLGISKEDPAQGARVLDRALSHVSPASPSEYYRALVLRADLATQLDDPVTVRARLSEAAALPLTDQERAALTDERTRATDLAAEGEAESRDDLDAEAEAEAG
ncbi:VOC family protein [Streptomyces sp. NPDC048290]|uniref:bleomycin resistance protein n=1 Tax=Streptomyces sp. NPDC048290 TaxID=3155811 RepID=UPI003424D629